MLNPSPTRPAGALRVGVISDVHADLGALERALSILHDHGADRVVCLGDVVEKGPDGDAVVALLQERCVPVMRGNHEDNAIKHAGTPRQLRREVSLSSQTIAKIGQYPASRLYCWERTFVLAAHGTPRDNGVYVFPDRAVPRALKKQLRSLGADIVLLGHTHRPMWAAWRGVLLLNPGSVCGRRPRDSHTCGLLSLPERRWTIFDLGTGQPVPPEVAAWSDQSVGGRSWV